MRLSEILGHLTARFLARLNRSQSLLASTISAQSIWIGSRLIMPPRDSPPAASS